MNPSANSTGETRGGMPLLSLLLAGVCLVATLTATGFLLVHMDRGLDITDEAFYLLSAHWLTPETLNITRFGYYSSGMLALVGGDIALFRSLGLLLLLVSTTYLAAAVIRLSSAWTSAPPAYLADEVAFVSACCMSALVFYAAWIPTPSYNWFVLVCVQIAIGGALWLASHGTTDSNSDTPRNHAKIESLHCALIGFAVVVCFFCKPTSGAAVGPLSLTALAFFLRPVQLPPLLLKIMLAGMVAAAGHVWILEEGPGNYLGMIEDGLEKRQLMRNGVQSHSVLLAALDELKSVPELLLSITPAALVLGLLPIVLPVARFVGVIVSSERQWKLQRLCLLLAMLVGSAVLFRENYWMGGTGHLWRSGEAMALMAALGIVSLAVGLIIRPPEMPKRPPLRPVLLAVLLFVSAMAFSFGSSNGLFRQSSMAAVFFFMSLLVAAVSLETGVRQRWLSSTAILLTLMLSAKLIWDMPNGPYRLPEPLDAQTHEIWLGDGNTRLYVDEATAAHVLALRDMAEQHGWMSGTPLIDLTGGTPVAALALGGRPVSVPWLTGGYPGSDQAAEYLLMRAAPETLHQSWLLLAPTGRRSISEQVLEPIGLDFPGSYVRVGKTVTGHRAETQFLWRPRSTAERNAEDALAAPIHGSTH